MKDIEELINKTINEETEENIRIPTNLKPIHYRLKIFPILDEYSPDNFTYTGEVKIIIRCLTKTNKIVLNLDDLDISEHNVTVSTLKTTILRYESLDKESDNDQPEIYQKNSTSHNSSVIIVEENSGNNSTDEILIGAETTSLPIQEVYKEEDNFKLFIIMRNLLEADHNYTINIKFAGNITNNLAGFYRTNYKDLSGHTRLGYYPQNSVKNGQFLDGWQQRIFNQFLHEEFFLVLMNLILNLLLRLVLHEEQI